MIPDYDPRRYTERWNTPAVTFHRKMPCRQEIFAFDEAHDPWRGLIGDVRAASPILDLEAPMRYKAVATDHILQLTRCQPFLVQLICTDVVEHLNQVNRANKTLRRTVTLDDVDAVLDAAMEHGGFYFDDIWHTASAAERVVLQHIASATFQHAEAAKAPLAALQKRELIEPYQGGYRFQVPLMQRWVLKLHRTKTQS